MYSPSLFVAVPVALFLVTCANPSAALVVRDRHHTPTKNKTMAAHPVSKPASPRRTRAKHVMSPATPSQAPNQRRGVTNPSPTNLDAYLEELTVANGNILTASNAFTSSAHTARTNPDGSSRQDVANKLASYQQTLGSLYPLFANIGADKGLANYDKSDQLETLLKNVVNTNKGVLGSASTLVDNDALLGPPLGQIVYDIKCILDELLDYTENASDPLLHLLSPLLQPLIFSATGIARDVRITLGSD